MTHPEQGKVVHHGAVADTTVERMQLFAALNALRHLEEFGLAGSASPVLWSLNQTLVSGMNEWLKGWKANGWRKADGSDVGNEDLWHELDSFQQRLGVRYRHSEQTALMKEARQWAMYEAQNLDLRQKGGDDSF